MRIPLVVVPREPRRVYKLERRLSTISVNLKGTHFFLEDKNSQGAKCATNKATIAKKIVFS